MILNRGGCIVDALVAVLGSGAHKRAREVLLEVYGVGSWMGLVSPVEADIDVERRYFAWVNVVEEIGERDDTRVLFVFFVRPSTESETPL